MNIKEDPERIKFVVNNMWKITRIVETVSKLADKYDVDGSIVSELMRQEGMSVELMLETLETHRGTRRKDIKTVDDKRDSMKEKFLKSHWGRIDPGYITSAHQFSRTCSDLGIRITGSNPEISHSMFDLFIKEYPDCIYPELVFTSVSDNSLKYGFKNYGEIGPFKEKWTPIIRAWVDEQLNKDEQISKHRGMK